MMPLIMLGIALNLPPVIERYVATTTLFEMGSHALLVFGWIPIFGILIWGFTQIWVDYKQGQYFNHLHWILININIPQGAINTPKGMEIFFNNLAGSKSAITWKEANLQGKFQAYFSLEIVSCEGEVKFYIRLLDKYQDLVEAALYAQYPEAQITVVDDYVNALPDKYPNDTHKLFGSELKLTKPTFYPIRTYPMFEHMGEKDNRFKDPLLNIIELMGKMQKNEYLWIQILIMQPDEQDWAKDGEKYLNKMMGKEEKHAPSMVSQIVGGVTWLPNEVLKQTTGLDLAGGGEHADAKSDDFRMFKMTPSERLVADAIAEKISKIGWYTKIRVLYAGPKDHFRKPLMASAIKGMFHPYAHLNMNKLGLHDPATPKDDYFWMEWQMYGRMTRLLSRYKLRRIGAGASPYILNSEELATLFHFPAADARTPVLATSGARRAEAPLSLPFAAEGDEDMSDWKARDKSGHGDDHHGEHGAGVLSVPTPHAPTDTGTHGHAPAAHHAVPAPKPTAAHAAPADHHHAAPSHQPSAAHHDAHAASVHEEPVSHHPKPVMHEADDFMPQPGRPAPLPPGLSLAPEPISDDDDAPSNLPVL